MVKASLTKVVASQVRGGLTLPPTPATASEAAWRQPGGSFTRDQHLEMRKNFFLSLGAKKFHSMALFPMNLVLFVGGDIDSQTFSGERLELILPLVELNLSLLRRALKLLFPRWR
jgi:hypothetical protein